MNQENNYILFVAKLVTTEYIIGKRLDNGDYNDPMNIEYNDEDGFFLVPYFYPVSNKRVKINSNHVVCEIPPEDINDAKLLDEYYELLENISDEDVTQLH